MNYLVELASIEDIGQILQLYSDRMKWFKENEIKQWSRYLQNHPKEEFIKAIENKNYYIIKLGSELIAGFELSTDSKDWNDNTLQAYYIYKVVTKVGYKKVGKVIFDICIEIAKRDGRKYLRLDCLKSNQKLNDIYENYGFKLIRYGSNDRYSYSLREMEINV